MYVVYTSRAVRVIVQCIVPIVTDIVQCIVTMHRCMSMLSVSFQCKRMIPEGNPRAMYVVVQASTSCVFHERPQQNASSTSI